MASRLRQAAAKVKWPDEVALDESAVENALDAGEGERGWGLLQNRRKGAELARASSMDMTIDSEFADEPRDLAKAHTFMKHRFEGTFLRLETLRNAWVRITIKSVRIDRLVSMPGFCYLG